MEKHKFASLSLTMWDRAISSKFWTHRVYKKCTFGNFQKKFLSPKMAAILNFQIFATNEKKKPTNLLLSPLPCEMERFHWNFPPTGYLSNLVLPILSQILEQNSCFPLGGHYACQCILFLVCDIFFMYMSFRKFSYYIHSHLTSLSMKNELSDHVLWENK